MGAEARAGRDATAPGAAKKKLLDHARWFFGAKATAATAKERILRALAAKATKTGTTGPPLLWPSNVLAWEIFRAALTQLQPGGFGGVIGLRYEALDFVFRMFGVGDDLEAEIFEKVQWLEQLYLERLNDKQKKKTNGR